MIDDADLKAAAEAALAAALRAKHPDATDEEIAEAVARASANFRPPGFAEHRSE